MRARTSRAWRPNTLTAEVRSPLKGPGSSWGFDALSCYLSLIFKHSIKWKNGGKHSWLKWGAGLGGGGGGACCTPLWIRHWYYSIFTIQRSKQIYCINIITIWQLNQMNQTYPGASGQSMILDHGVSLVSNRHKPKFFRILLFSKFWKHNVRIYQLATFRVLILINLWIIADSNSVQIVLSPLEKLRSVLNPAPRACAQGVSDSCSHRRAYIKEIHWTPFHIQSQNQSRSSFFTVSQIFLVNMKLCIHSTRVQNIVYHVTKY